VGVEFCIEYLYFSTTFFAVAFRTGGKVLGVVLCGQIFFCLSHKMAHKNKICNNAAAAYESLIIIVTDAIREG
jgi:hypothetical protein